MENPPASVQWIRKAGCQRNMVGGEIALPANRLPVEEPPAEAEPPVDVDELAPDGHLTDPTDPATEDPDGDTGDVVPAGIAIPEDKPAKGKGK